MRFFKALVTSSAITFVALLAGCGEEEPAASSAARKEARSAALESDHVVATGAVCAPSGAHQKHATFACSTCHACGGVLQFASPGPAIAAGKPAPAFDATTKTCSNVACHGIPTGTFTYWFQGGDGEPEQKSYTYGSTAFVTPSWYSSGGATCTRCHGNPPMGPTWHGYHSAGNQCELCHPDAVSSGGVATGLSTATNCGPNGTYGVCAALHANGVVDVQARFTRTCFNCH